MTKTRYPRGAEAIRRQIAADEDLEREGRLQPYCGGFFLRAAGRGGARGVVLALHGFSAGPYQYAELGDALRRRGLHVYAPRLPGHGFQRSDGQEDSSLLPPASASAAYACFAEQAWAQSTALAESAGLPLFLVGLSAGGTLALDILRRHPQTVERAVLVAPFLAPRRAHARLLLGALRLIHKRGLPGLVFDQVPCGWGEKGRTEAVARGRRGHWRFRLGNVYAVASYAHDVVRQSRPIDRPVQILVNDNDDTVDNGAVLRLHRTLGPTAQLERIRRQEGAPHALLSERENPDATTRLRTHELVVGFLDPHPAAP